MLETHVAMDAFPFYGLSSLSFSFFVMGSYLFGSIPFGLIFTRFFGQLDIRSVGSGNIGATNVLRSGHRLLALLTLVCDGFKGLAPILLYRFLIPHSASDMAPALEVELILAGAAISGHLFPVFLKFKGGKGIATTAGALTLLSFPTSLIAASIWGILFFKTRQSSLAGLIATLFLPLYGYLFSGFSLMVWSFSVGMLILYKHKDNIQRLFQGKETKIAPLS